ncbi:MAG: hypothetical protein KJ655_05925 [Candidatus Thermoplasmatota archaeon]|nr:hypothetical protein [Candidatus Thermoplasmatota archaeon]
MILKGYCKDYIIVKVFHVWWLLENRYDEDNEKKDVQIQKLREVCAQLTEKTLKLEAENAKLKKQIKK